MKKKIAIVFNRMIVGGAEKALLNFLDALDKERYDITLFTLDDKGAYFDEIPDNVRVEYTGYSDTRTLLLNDLKHLRLFRLGKGLVLRILTRISRGSYEQFAYPMMLLPKFPEEYDCAIAYKLGCEDTATLLTRIRAKKKCAFVHNDTAKNKYISSLYYHLESVTRIFCVSRCLKQHLDTLYPNLSKKTDVLYNLIDSKSIVDSSQIDLSVRLLSIPIVTVGRLSSEKGQQMIPETARMLVDAGYDIHWYLVGDGPLREEVERESEKHGVSDHVILLGTQSNPYPYIKNCDIYVQPSFSEGWGLTVQEARILHKPIVTTPVPVFGEQIVSGENGLIVDEMTPKALFDGIKTLIDHTEMREKFVENLEKEDHDNSKEMQKLYDFIES